MAETNIKSFKKRPISTITLRILAINLTAVVMLAVGILYVVQYQDDLIQAELDSMRAEAQLFAGAIAEGATKFRLETSFQRFQPFQSLSGQLLIPDLSRRMVRRLSETKNVHVRLYNTLGDLVTDSSKITGPTGVIQSSPLLDDKIKTQLSVFVDRGVDTLLSLMPQRTQFPAHPDVQTPNALSYPDATAALQGITAASAWDQGNGEILLSAAAPVQRVRQVMGVVYLTKSGARILQDVRNMQIEILKIFGIVFTMSIVFSFYLAGTMAGPLKRLAAAAEKIRKTKSRDIEIPNMSDRGDEIGELSMALRDMTESLWLRMDAVERFAADVSHELKNPLTSLRSAVETVSKIKDEASRQTLMDIIMHDVRRLDRLISDISKASRLDAELSKTELVKLDLHEMLARMERVHSLARSQRNDEGEDEQDGGQRKKRASVIFSLSAIENTYVMASDTRLMQVFDNLIANAISFSPEGGTVTISTGIQGKTCRITVEDEGPGIPPNKLKTVFDRFYSERPDGEAYGNNSGLGLSIAKQIIDAHQGRIYAENIRDASGETIGARFSVELFIV